MWRSFYVVPLFSYVYISFGNKTVSYTFLSFKLDQLSPSEVLKTFTLSKTTFLKMEQSELWSTVDYYSITDTSPIS